MFANESCQQSIRKVCARLIYINEIYMNKTIDITEKLAGQSTRLILSTGSPLLPHHYDYLYSSFDYPIQVGSISGGTDIISCFVLFKENVNR